MNAPWTRKEHNGHAKPSDADLTKHLLRYWERHVRRELEAEIELITGDETLKQKMIGFLDRVESRLVANVVKHDVPQKIKSDAPARAQLVSTS